MRKFLIAIICLSFGLSLFANEKPSLLLTKKGVEDIIKSKGLVPAFDASLTDVLRKADEAVESSIEVPIPKDGGGGYTHELHKLNYYKMYDCGIAWQLTKETKYAQFVVDMLKAYAQLYPTLGFHPMTLSKTPGRIFWQTLNESVWLVHTSIAYDCVYDYMSKKERANIEKNLFYPMADFLMNGLESNRNNFKTFNKMHNHGTWATSAVGMIGLVMEDKDLVNKALYGSDETGENGGFIRQLDYLFSPDGYFTEGAYYLRYAIWPFILFAQCIDNNLPDIKIFEYRDSVLLKAVNVLVQLAYEGDFMRFNDALLKGYDAQELVAAVNIAYNADPSNKMLLDVAANYQDWVLPTDAGFAVARDIADGQIEKLKFESKLYSDGKDGEEGGIAVIRSTDSALNSALTLKATAHGLSHGHYDKLTFAYYDNGNEVLMDYGAARWLNIEAKYKGHYTVENKGFAMTTIAHNTLVVDETSQFKQNYKESMKHHSEILFTDFSNPDKQVISAKENNAYEGVDMYRTVAYFKTSFLQYPLILDLYRVESDQEHTYDFPMWYGGHFVSTNFPYTKAINSKETFGSKNGYQYLWKDAWGVNKDNCKSTFTWIQGDRFYSLNTNTTPESELYFVQVGANDPNFHLKPNNGYIIRENGVKDRTFFSVIETHGTYDLQLEQSYNLTSSCESVEVILDTEEYTVAVVRFTGGYKCILAVANQQLGLEINHKVTTSEGELLWIGPYTIIE